MRCVNAMQSVLVKEAGQACLLSTSCTANAAAAGSPREERADGAAYADVVSVYAAPGGTSCGSRARAGRLGYLGSRLKTAFDQK
ncbi:hypothetical protein GCM10010207_05000 [Streptomyces atratus]|nr:hypothetical protein GCM10010207_05000 [Streptomyces atratus]